jgi:hypothetical protein
MADVVELVYRSSDSELATQVARLWPHRECEPISCSDNSAVWDCIGGGSWTYQNLCRAKTFIFAFGAKK